MQNVGEGYAAAPIDDGPAQPHGRKEQYRK
jgi:hypothetical protein